MGFSTEIGWTDSTFNPWLGCVKISWACRFCYAEASQRRWAPAAGGRRADVWGRNAPRRRTSAQYWRKPLAWNRKAQQARRPLRVFCASLADVFEDHPMLPPWREDLFTLTEATPWLRWMLLTKRIDLVENMTAARWGHDWPTNVWLGTSVEGQPEADARLSILLNLTGPTERFVSAEPIRAPFSVAPHLSGHRYPLSLLIGGGESGRSARYDRLDVAARQLRDETAAAGVPFMWKQWGEYAPCDQLPAQVAQQLAATRDLSRPHQEPHRVGKGRAGRLLDGRTHDGVVASWAAQCEELTNVG